MSVRVRIEYKASQQRCMKTEVKVSFVILNEVKNHYAGVSAKETDSSLRSE